jgi:hypothetical protein
MLQNFFQFMAMSLFITSGIETLLEDVSNEEIRSAIELVTKITHSINIVPTVKG